MNITQDADDNSFVFTDHPDNDRLRGQDTKELDRTDAVCRICSPGHLVLCLASSKSIFS